MKNPALLFALLIFTGCSLFAQTDAKHYKVIRKFPVQGNGGWDDLTVDDAAQLLYVSHGNEVQVLNLKTGSIVATIPDTHGVHGIALDTFTHKGFISNGKDTSVTVFDTRDFKVLNKIKTTGLNPDIILFDMYSNKVFVFNGKSNNATVIDPAQEKVLGTIPLNGKPEFAKTNDHGMIYVNIEDKNQIAVIDARELKILNYWNLSPGEGPSGLALDFKNHLLFSVCDNKLMMVMNALSGRVVTSLPIGENPDGAGFDSQLNCAYSSNGDGTLTVVKEIDGHTMKVLGNVQTQKGARTMALSNTTHHIYLPVAEYEEKMDQQKEAGHHRPPVKPGSFTILEVAP